MTEATKISLEGIAGAVPGLKAIEIKRFRTRTFKSGNSLALRLPAGVGLEAGVEIELRVQQGETYEFWPVEAPKRKFAIDKVWGSATDLELINPADRLFEERPLFNGEAPDEEPK